VVTQSRHYLFGLIQAQRKNMERMVEAVPGTNWQSLHHYTSDSPWDPFAVMDRIGNDANSVIGNDPDCCMIVDESAFTKRGTKSVGVARQWNGRLGKVDNRILL
jgi:SRSO17 transposase